VEQVRKRDYYYFEQARQEALKSDFGSIKLGSVLVYKGKIIGRGHNSKKTAPVQKYYNRYRKFNKTAKAIEHSLHAEIACIKSIHYTVKETVDFSRCKIYTYRICPGKPLGYGCAKSCPGCMHAIKDIGIKDVYYTEDNGYAYLRLEN
jgi:tRNA(Arg) A34 adenosine deaminase TadA